MTSVTLPPSVPFPVTVSAVLSVAGQNVQKHSLLFKYKYWDYQADPSSSEQDPPKIRVERIGSFESPIEGEIVAVKIRPNDEIAHSGVELYVIREKCTHTVQYGGLCALCGMSIEDEKDYSGYTYEDRATISMSHDNSGLRVSVDEAAKIEKSATEKLVEDKKLILVVDLDQTVIHATVDPTVGEWQRDPSNPNFPYVKDVRSFSLDEEQVLPPGWTGPRPPPSKCWYYVKLRPGLGDFLAHVSELYELHIYTMATRNYALAIAGIIDPTGQYFGDRILSRDESGSLTHKNLKRLFPVDQSMVVIIDDRGDVWSWESNLIKVVPYDFFVGIGDINSSFLPKKNGQLLGPTKKRKSIAQLEELENSDLDASEDTESSNESSEKPGIDEVKLETNGDEKSGSGEPRNDVEMYPEGDNYDGQEMDNDHEHDQQSPVDRMLHLGGGENNKDLLRKQSMTRSQVVEQQQHDRPLAKLQNNLDKMLHEHDTPTPESDGDDEDQDHLLRDDDSELGSLESALRYIHEEYFKLFSKYRENTSLPRPDLTTIIPELKRTCLDGVVILFSGIIPLGMNIDNADIVIWCRQFGVRVVNEVYPEVTHVVCRDPSATLMKPGLTLKVRVAKKTLPGVKIVSPDWLFACLSSWSKVLEDEYLIDVPEQDWYVSSTDVEKYQNALEAQKQKQQMRGLNMKTRQREDSLSSLEEYDFNDASAEVDDFLAGLSEDEDANDAKAEDDSDANHSEEDSEQDSEDGEHSGSSFLRGLYSESAQKRKATDDVSDEDEDEDEDYVEESRGKKRKTEEDMDMLEKELLNELDNME